MRVHLTLFGGSLLDLTIGEDSDDDDPRTFGFHGGSTCVVETGETMLDSADSLHAPQPLAAVAVLAGTHLRRLLLAPQRRLLDTSWLIR